LFQSAANRLQGYLRLLSGDRWFQPSEHLKRQQTPVLVRRASRIDLRHHVGIAHRGRPHIGRQDAKRSIKPERRNTDDRERVAIQSNRVAENAGIAAELPLPEFVIQYRNRTRASLFVLLRKKETANRRFHAEQ